MSDSASRERPRPAPALGPPLGSWLMATVLSAVMLAVLACALLIESFARAHAERGATESLRQISAGFREALDRGMARQYQEMQVLAGLEQLRRLDDPAAVRRALDQVRLGFGHFAWIGLSDARGQVLAASDGWLEGVDVSSLPWWQGAQGGPFVGDVRAAALLEKLLPEQAEPWRFVDFAVPIRSERGELQGVLGAYMSWNWVRRIEAELIDKAMQAHEAQALVLAQDGTILLGPRELEGKRLASLAPALRAEPGAGQQAEIDGRPSFIVTAATRGHGNYAGLGWTVLLHKPVELALADYYRLRRQIMVIALVLVAVFVPLVWLLARRLSAPLVELAAAISDRRHLREAKVPRVGGYREASLLSNALADLSERQATQDARLEQRVEERTAELQRAMEQVEASEQRLRAVAHNIPAMVGYFDRQQQCRFFNGSGQQLGGLPAEDVAGLSMRELIGELSYTQHEPHVGQALAGMPARFDGRLMADGEPRYFESHLVPDRDAQGQVQGFYLMTFDITRLKQAELNAARSEARLRTITDNLPVLISYIDRDERLRFLNGTFQRWLGLDPRQALGRSFREVIGETLYEPRRPYLERALAGERVSFETVSEALGVSRHLKVSYVPDRSEDGEVAGVYTLSTDISAAKQIEQHLARLTRVDALTGGPNRRQFEERLPEALARAQRNGLGVALLFLDIDKFKHINDSLGHAAGDLVLIEFAARLNGCVRATDMVARLGGDEFVLILEGLHSEQEPEMLARKVLADMARPFQISGQAVAVSTSIGLVCSVGGHGEPGELLARADEALYAAKAAGRATFKVAPPVVASSSAG
jgi:diguanylate cyclase (GGDEF)-like protein/PAS domain S-box-containing protein